MFYVVLLFGSDVMPARFMRSRDVFLDKACIHQVDKTLQRQGIESLGGFLFYSWSMVVLYTPVYTTKSVDCVRDGMLLERASWRSSRLAASRSWACGAIALSFLTMLAHCVLLGDVVWYQPESRMQFQVCSSCHSFASVCSTFIFHNVVRDQVKSEADLNLFSIRNAVCAVEGDRAVVEGNVASLMRDLKLAPLDSTHEQALRAFDLMVRTTMPRAIRDSVGRARLRYELVVIVFASAGVWLV